MRVIILALLFVPALALADGDAYVVDGKGSSLTYHLVHKLHRFDATSKHVEGKALILPDGKAQVMVRAPIESFDSQNVNRDAHMKETVEAARFPTVELKAIGEGLAIPSSFPSTIQKSWKAQLTFHGEQKMFEVPVKVVFESRDKVRAEVAFSISVEAFKIERPSLMFVKIDDEMKIDGVLSFRKQ